MEYNFQHYLKAKRTVDDRALNRLIWQQMSEQLQLVQSVHVLEIGAGIGTMLHRLVEWGGLKRGTYLGIDSDHASIEGCQGSPPAVGERAGIELHTRHRRA